MYLFNAPSNYLGSYSSDPSIAVAGMVYFNTSSNVLRFHNGSAWGNFGSGTGDASTNTASSVDSEIALFSSTTGKLLKRATQTGILVGTSGVISAITTSAGLAGQISDETGSGALVFGTSPTIATPTISGAIAFPDGVRQTFNPDGTTPGLNVGSQAGDPSTPSNGDLWYDSTANELTARINGANVALGAGGSTYNESNPINDTSSNELLKFVKVISAVNEISISNNATGSSPIISATGGDSNIGIDFNSKGTGSFNWLSGYGSGNTVTLSYPASLQTSLKVLRRDASSVFVEMVAGYDGSNGNSYIKIGNGGVSELFLSNSHSVYQPGTLVHDRGGYPAGITIDSNNINGGGASSRAVCPYNMLDNTIDLGLVASRWKGVWGVSGGFTQILDTNSNELLKFTSVASAVNEITVSNNSTGNPPIISATGGDTDIDIKLSPKGAGAIISNQSLGTAHSLIKGRVDDTYTYFQIKRSASTYGVTIELGQGANGGTIQGENNTDCPIYLKPCGSTDYLANGDTGRVNITGGLQLTPRSTGYVNSTSYPFDSNVTVATLISTGSVGNYFINRFGIVDLKGQSTWTVTSASTVRIDGAPTQGTNNTITNRYAFWVADGTSRFDKQLNLIEQTAPSAPPSNSVYLYAEDNGSGKTRLMALFPTGSAQQIAIEP